MVSSQPRFNLATTPPPHTHTVSGPCVAQEFEAILAEVGASGDLPTFDRIERMFPFPLDPFQRDAVEHTLGDSSVVVCAPTGAGKTAIAVAAAVPVLAAGYRVIYTTPLKALSNQKLFELQVPPPTMHAATHAC